MTGAGFADKVSDLPCVRSVLRLEDTFAHHTNSLNLFVHISR
ncbi:MAG: hypothetical protein RL180_1678 [Pseudomonadota bacterium]